MPFAFGKVISEKFSRYNVKIVFAWVVFRLLAIIS
jgi:hypothetical protein